MLHTYIHVGPILHLPMIVYHCLNFPDLKHLSFIGHESKF